ncbi:hypothetical protein [Aliarcobacter lanthieri]|uniref:hypothetical protein n=1 Tax=Aliarcobacter lanthieri TaxID=1355374 RepID=UPI00047D993C|nr:hypothetical protein [Aliarcobacter lanthieri]QKF60262.1 hypothetical protein ALANTH_2200 [Aliarcobacter lanthieri]
MKRLIMQSAFFAGLIMLVSGCAVVNYTAEALNPRIGTTEVDGVYIPREAVLEQNKNTKVYYEDANSEIVKDNLKNIVTYLNNNNQTFVPKVWCVVENPEATIKDMKSKCTKNTSNNKIEGITFKVDEKSNYIVADKSYSSSLEAYKDFINIREYIYGILNDNPNLRDDFGMSAIVYINDEALENKQLSFTTSREKARELLEDRIKRQVAAGGWIMVDNPKDADKTITFSFSRGFSGAELEKLKKEDKNIKQDIFISINNKKEFTFSVNDIKDFYSDSIKNVNTQGNVHSSGAGVAAGGAFILMDILASSDKRKRTISNEEYLFPAIVLSENNKNNLIIYGFGMIFDSKEGISSLLKRISSHINQWPESKWSEIYLN